MSKSDCIKLEGVVIKVLPASFYKVKVSINNNEFELLCQPNGKMKMNSIILTVGDAVSVELSPYDMTKGRITYRLQKK